MSINTRLIDELICSKKFSVMINYIWNTIFVAKFFPFFGVDQ